MGATENNTPSHDEVSASEQQEELEFSPPQTKMKSKEEEKADRVKILKRLDELRKRKRENEYFIRVSQQTIKYRTQELQREIKKRYNRIRRIRRKNGKDMADFDDLLMPIEYETVGVTAVPIIEPVPPMMAMAPMMGRINADHHDHNNEDAASVDSGETERTEEDVTESEVEEIRSEIDTIKERISHEIETIRFEIEEKKIENSEIERLMRNNWDPQNVATVTKWIKEGDKQSFIYDRVRDSLQKRVKILTVIIMVVSGIQSLLSVSNFGLSEEDYPTLVLVFKIITAVLSTIVFIITSYIKNSRFEDVIQSITSYVEKIENFLSGMVSIADVKPELRPDGDSFVTENRETYAQIYREAPNISKGQWNDGMKDYKNYVLNADPEKEIHCSRKRENYAYFARQNVEEADVHSVWSGARNMGYGYGGYGYGGNGGGNGGRYGTFGKTEQFRTTEQTGGIIRSRRKKKTTPSEERRNNINRSLKSGNIEHHGITSSTDGDTGSDGDPVNIKTRRE
jgi:hypothetical protein